MIFQNVMPTIGVTDLKLALDYYASLGFKFEWIWPDHHPTHASMSRDKTHLMFVQKKQEDIQQADLYFIVTNVSGLHQDFLAKDIKIGPLIQSEYNMLDFSLHDPWGHHLTFGQASEDSELKTDSD